MGRHRSGAGGRWPGQADDGLALAERLPLYVVVEKILEPGEPLPNDWAVHGTVGYEFARVTTGLFVDPAHQRAFDDLYARVHRGGPAAPFAAVAYEAKGLMLRTALASETNVLARALNRISEQNRRTRDFTLNALRNALREVIACFPVYRTYITCDPHPARSPTRAEGRTDPARTRLDRTGARSSGRWRWPSGATRPPTRPSSISWPTSSSCRARSGRDALSEQERDERCRFVMKFQQLTGPVMAKGVEDTAFYLYNRLVALNEVGSDPAAFGVSVAEFHRQNAERARRWPHALLTSSTHDTKRSEDVRARIAVLSELPREWRAAVNRWARLNRRAQDPRRGRAAPDRNDEYLLYQTLLGAWPWGVETPDEAFVARIEAYMLKAAREAQVHTSWVNPERGLRGRAAAASCAPRSMPRGRTPFLEDFAALREMVAHAGAINALAQQLLKLTAPGRAGHLPGDGAVGPEPGRPGQPPPGRLRPAHPPLARVAAASPRAAGWPPICSRRKRTGGSSSI